MSELWYRLWTWAGWNWKRRIISAVAVTVLAVLIYSILGHVFSAGQDDPKVTSGPSVSASSPSPSTSESVSEGDSTYGASSEKDRQQAMQVAYGFVRAYQNTSVGKQVWLERVAARCLPTNDLVKQLATTNLAAIEQARINYRMLTNSTDQTASAVFVLLNGRRIEMELVKHKDRWLVANLKIPAPS